MNKEQLISLLYNKRGYIKKGVRKLSELFNASIDDVIEAKKEVRKLIDISKLTNTNDTRYHKSKILILDIETAPLLAALFDVWNVNVYSKNIIIDWFILSWAAKWLGNDNILSDVLVSKEALEQDDKRILVSLSDVINQADIIITYNGSKFDMPRIDTRLFENNLQPTKPYSHIDLYKTTKRFSFTHKGLDDINKKLGLSRKKEINHKFDLWKRCFFGDSASLEELREYNKQDTISTEELYIKYLPWIKNHPNMSFFTDNDRKKCSKCGSDNIRPLGKEYYTKVGAYPVWICESCGSFSRERYTSIPRTDSKNILRSM